MSKSPKALALISGGLDSMLAAKIIMNQGIYLEGINFFTGFCGDSDDFLKQYNCGSCKRCKTTNEKIDAHFVAAALNLKVNYVNVFEEYKTVVQNPRYGYGANLNPCLDCKIFMVSQAKKWAQEHGFDFIVTGEVVGQRPKSQLKHMLPVVERLSETQDILLRPLSAKLLAPTLPEREGWVNRDLLFGISGRSRAAQAELAKNLGITKYAQPAGGCCFLINHHYCGRLNDVWGVRKSKDFSLEDVLLLKAGRHLRPCPEFKMIIGRVEEENEYLEQFGDHFITMVPTNCPGPLVLIDGVLKDEAAQNLAARILARYCKHGVVEKVDVQLKKVNDEIINLS